MTKETNLIVREAETSFADNRGYVENYQENEEDLFIIPLRGYAGFNEKRYNEIVQEAEQVQALFNDQKEYKEYPSYKEIMEDYAIYYTPIKCKKIKEWAANADTYKTEDIAEYLTICSGQKYDQMAVRGYSQSDYIEIVYNKKMYTEKQVVSRGQIWLGCYKEFDLIENGEYIGGGWIIADNEWIDYKDLKKRLAEYGGLGNQKFTVELFDGYSSRPKYKEI